MTLRIHSRPALPLQRGAALVLTVAAAVAPLRASALQSLQEFLRAARSFSPDAREGLANIDAQRAQSELALGRLAPNVALRGSYQRNEYAVSFPAPTAHLLDPNVAATQALTLTPSNQLDLSFNLGVPLVNVAGMWALAVARLGTEAATHQLDATLLQVEAQAVQAWYQVVADQALVSASGRALDVSRASRDVTHERVRLGRSPALEQDRADAQVELQVQQLAAAELLLANAMEALQSTSGLKPETGSRPVQLQDNLQEEAPLETYEPGRDGTPAMAAASSARATAQKQLDATWLTLLPVLSGSFQEHDGNYPGFSGHDASWTAGLTLQWGLDYTAYAALHAQKAQLAAAEAREDRVNIQVRQIIHDSWAAVHAAIARSRSARVQEQATRHAEQLAQDRYEAGSSTQLDLLQAQRDAFGAEVTRIQADADLANARAQLRLAAGRDLLSDSGEAP
jgi:outer membrane protein TolC